MAGRGKAIEKNILKITTYFFFMKFWTVKVAGLRERGYSNAPKQSPRAQN